eukprot:CAMPEP_0177677518 /NCGR_PEP_ID=MMETSP0447-20121125/28442_1 /TAXON_ID=0 /ORGANISM="Stygamoeba regulata, Strain BSH-02190019" /LENGTH=166 /DNA_ID=CAMNT_0019186307 /DNA_START=106 /DNA_END=603 /DNA_ORIENTATION=+
MNTSATFSPAFSTLTASTPSTSSTPTTASTSSTPTTASTSSMSLASLVEPSKTLKRSLSPAAKARRKQLRQRMRGVRAEVRRVRAANEALRREILYLQEASSARRWQVFTVAAEKAPAKLHRMLRERDWRFEELAVGADHSQLSFLLYKPAVVARTSPSSSSSRGQ